jgi:LacI family transcriptional regulator
MATINDVAKRSGLSVGTISRYINGVKLKQSNMDAIEESINELGYRTNGIARSMKTGRSLMIAIIVPSLANMFSMRVIESMERVLEVENYSVLVSDCLGDTEKEHKKLSLLCDKMVDGFFIMTTGEKAADIKKIVKDKPVVLIDRTLDEPIFDSVTIDNKGAAYRLVKRALENGVRKIGMIEGPQNLFTAKERSLGFCDALKEYGIETKYIKQAGYDVESGYKAMYDWIDSGLEAVFASNYEQTVGAMNALYDAKKKIRIIGFDSLELSFFTNQTYDYISQPVEEIGIQAAKLLLERIKNPEKEISDIVLQV